MQVEILIEEVGALGPIPSRAAVSVTFGLALDDGSHCDLLVGSFASVDSAKDDEVTNAFQPLTVLRHSFSGTHIYAMCPVR